MKHNSCLSYGFALCPTEDLINQFHDKMHASKLSFNYKHKSGDVQFFSYINCSQFTSAGLTYFM